MGRDISKRYLIRHLPCSLTIMNLSVNQKQNKLLRDYFYNRKILGNNPKPWYGYNNQAYLLLIL